MIVSVARHLSEGRYVKDKRDRKFVAPTLLWFRDKHVLRIHNFQKYLHGYEVFQSASNHILPSIGFSLVAF